MRDKLIWWLMVAIFLVELGWAASLASRRGVCEASYVEWVREGPDEWRPVQTTSVGRLERGVCVINSVGEP